MNPDVGEIRRPDLVNRSQSPILDQVRVNRQRVTGIGRPHECPPGNRFQAELLHHPANPFVVHAVATAFQLASNAPIAVARKLLLNAFDLLPQILIAVFMTAAMLRIELVVIAAGRKSRYLAGFRN